MKSVERAADDLVRAIAARLFRKASIQDSVACTRAFTDEEYGKIYSTYRIQAESGSIYVLKRAETMQEFLCYTRVFGVHDPVPRIYQYEEREDNQFWLLLEHVGDEDIRDSTLTEHISAVEAIAAFHANHWLPRPGNTADLPDAEDALREYDMFLSSYVRRPREPDIKELREICGRILQRFSTTGKTVLHGDLLSMNILVKNGKTTLIDWDAAMTGCYAQDIGRWLGDLRHANAEKWIPQEWEETLLKRYHEVLFDRYGLGCRTFGDMIEDYEYGKQLNYLKVIIQHLRCGWEKSDWYEANLSALLA